MYSEAELQLLWESQYWKTCLNLSFKSVLTYLLHLISFRKTKKTKQNQTHQDKPAKKN